MTNGRAVILVDANIARSAAENGDHPTTRASLSLARTLQAKDCETDLLMTPALRSEWREHASPLMSGWLVEMFQRRRVRSVVDKPVRDLRNAVNDVLDAGVKNALMKDLHLSEAAILRCAPVASLDDRQRRYLRVICDTYKRAGDIQWLNPEKDAEWDGWIRGGCVDPERFSVAECA